MTFGDPQPVHRKPTEKESELMRMLAIGLAAEGIGCSHIVAADALDKLSAAGRVQFTGDSMSAAITVGGHRLVEVDRDWLLFRAAVS